MQEEIVIVQRGPSARQASRWFLLLLLALMIGSALLAPRLGIGGNLWVNELVYFTLPPLILARLGGWKLKETFRFQKASGSQLGMAALLGSLLWIVSSTIWFITEQALSSTLGELPSAFGVGEVGGLQAILLLVGIVILAPFCEELFFRGFLQRGYEQFGVRQSIIITGVLFGAMHILNGLPNWLPTTILGIVLSYVAFATNSIWPAIVLHAANNFIARIGTAVLTQAAPEGMLPNWWYLMTLLVLFAAYLVLRWFVRVAAANSAEQHVWRSEQPVRSFWRSRAIWLSIFILLFGGGAELAVRAGVIETEAGTETNFLTAGEFDGSLTGFGQTVGENQLDKTLEYRYEISADSLNVKMQLLNPAGEVVWEKPWAGSGMTAGSGWQQATLDQMGDWSLVIVGEGEGVKFRTYWRIR